MTARILSYTLRSLILMFAVLIIFVAVPKVSNAQGDCHWVHDGYWSEYLGDLRCFPPTNIYTNASVGIGGSNVAGVPLKVYGNIRANGICDENGSNCKDISQGWGSTVGHSLNAADGSPTDVVYVDNDGKVGIGTTTPQSALSVNGTVTAKEVIVTTEGFPAPDFVFESGYHLLSLNEVDTFILQNKHLPGVPSAREVAGEGVNLSKMLAIQLQKIEEMTLYLIQLKKENEILKSRIVALETVNSRFLAR